MRRVLAGVAGLMLLVVAGCANEAGPQPEGQPGDPGPEALRVKLDALTVDRCYTQPTQQRPKNCEKYVTQLANVVGRVDKHAAAGGPQAAQRGRELDTAIAAYRDNGCNVDEPASPDACTGALTDIATALHAIKSGFADATAPPG